MNSVLLTAPLPLILALSCAGHGPARNPAQTPPHKLEWTAIERRLPGEKTTFYWQASDPGEPARDPSADAKALVADDLEKRRLEPIPADPCPSGMVHVRGKFGARGMIGPGEHAQRDWTVWVLRKQAEACEDKNYDSRFYCNRFDPKPLEQTEHAKSGFFKPLDFCIDRYEYPNAPGRYPAVMASWTDADALCQQQGKRLCGEDEWTYACEGPDAHPYPYGDGFTRDPSACNIETVPAGAKLPVSFLKEDPEGRRDAEGVKRELAEHWGAVPSGSMRECRSQFGVYDMAGNVDEWTRSSPGWPREKDDSVLKGGWWMPVRSRCRPSTTSHGRFFRDYNIGFRCCKTAN